MPPFLDRIELVITRCFSLILGPWLARAKILALCAAILVALLPACVAAAQPVVEITDAWVRATVPGQQVAGAYLAIRSARAAKLIGVKSPVAKSAEIHSMSNAGGVMRMRKLDGLALPAGERVELQPAGNHIMLFDIKRQLQPGEKIPITLIVEERGKRKTVKVEAEVRRE
jgi:copper(I)-binding protein